MLKTAVVFLISLSLSSFIALAETKPESRSETQAYAVQQRPQQMKKEIFLHTSFLPADHFTQYFTLGGGYTHYFNSYFGWEVLNFHWANAVSTKLESYLASQYSVDPEAYDVIKYWGTTNLIYTPFYMKNLFMGREVVWGDLSLVAGYGLATLKATGNVNVIDVGANLRFFANDSWAYKLDLRQYFYFTSAIKPNFGITFSVAYNFGSLEPQKSEVAQ